jgi:hypothetical protein
MSSVARRQTLAPSTPSGRWSSNTPLHADHALHVQLNLVASLRCVSLFAIGVISIECHQSYNSRCLIAMELVACSAPRNSGGLLLTPNRARKRNASTSSRQELSFFLKNISWVRNTFFITSIQKRAMCVAFCSFCRLFPHGHTCTNSEGLWLK